MTRFFVSRHPGAIAWQRAQGLEVDRVVAHLDPTLLIPGDVVMGSLPIHLAAEVCRKGAEYFHLTLSLQQHERGQELSVERMDACDAHLRRYRIVELD